MPHSGRSAADDVLALAVATGETIRSASALAGVSEATAHRRMGNKKFRDRIVRLRADVVCQAVGRLGGSMGAAADALRTLLASEVESIKLSAARAVLELGCRLWQAADQQNQIEAIQDDLAEIKRQQPGKAEPRE